MVQIKCSMAVVDKDIVITALISVSNWDGRTFMDNSVPGDRKLMADFLVL